MPITGFGATISAYGRAVCDLFDELDEGVAALQLGQKTPDLVADGARDDNRGAFVDQPPGDCVTARHCNHGDRAIKLGSARHCSPSAAPDASSAASTSARASTASAMATKAADASAV